MVYMIFRVYKIFPKAQYTAAVLVAGMTMFPFALGSCAMLYILAYCILYYYIRGWFLPWVPDDFIEHSREVDFRKIAMSSEENRKMIYEYLLEHPQLTPWARLCNPKTKMSFDEKFLFFFNLFDPDRDGFIDKEEFLEFFVDFGIQRWAIESSFDSWKSDKDGRGVNFEQFKASLTSDSQLIQQGFDGFLHDIRLDHGLLEYLDSFNDHVRKASMRSLQSMKTADFRE